MVGKISRLFLARHVFKKNMNFFQETSCCPKKTCSFLLHAWDLLFVMFTSRKRYNLFTQNFYVLCRSRLRGILDLCLFGCNSDLKPGNCIQVTCMFVCLFSCIIYLILYRKLYLTIGYVGQKVLNLIQRFIKTELCWTSCCQNDHMQNYVYN